MITISKNQVNRLLRNGYVRVKSFRKRSFKLVLKGNKIKLIEKIQRYKDKIKKLRKML